MSLQNPQPQPSNNGPAHNSMLDDQTLKNSRNPARLATKWRLALRFALREMRGGLKGFYIFLACIALGVAAIGGVGGIAGMIDAEFTAQGKVILGGDLRFSMTQRAANEKEFAFLKAQGNVSSSMWMRSMARRVDNNAQTLVEIKAVDEKYPLYGTLKTVPSEHDPKSMKRFSDQDIRENKKLAQSQTNTLFAKKDGYYGVAVAQLFLDRLELKLGDRINIGEQSFVIRAILDEEPDLLAEGFQLGLRVFMAKDAMATTGLLQPGSLFVHIYKIAMPDASDQELDALKIKAEKDFPDARWNIRTRMNAAPILKSNIERFSQFLTLVGLTSLLVGGVGVGNAVKSYLDNKRGVIATLKSLGASGNFVTMLYLIQIMLLALIGIAIGFVFAALLPIITAEILRKFLPVMGYGGFYPASLLMGALFALLTALAFALIPLARAREIPVTSLFRNMGFDQSIKIKNSYRFITGALMALIAALAIFTAYDRRMAIIFILAMIGVFVVLRLLAALIRFLARRFSHVRSTALRLAIGNIYRPGALTNAIVLALGLGLTLLVALATIDGNLRNQLTSSVPQDAPAFFFLDIPGNEGDRFSALLKERDPDSVVRIMPTLRARITKINAITVNMEKVPEKGRWVLRGDRNVTYSTSLPDDTTLTKGTWWEKDYQGPPLVSFSQREADDLRLKVGDRITINALGRTIDARIANLRAVDWDSMKMNFVMIFSPNTFQGAPHVWLSTLQKSAKAGDDGALMRAIGKEFPSVTAISVSQVLDNARTLVDQIGLAVRTSASIALVASVLVLAGALSAGNRARTHDAVVLKTLGATRKTLIRAFIYEYVILGYATALFAFVAGSTAGWAVAKFRMDLKAIFLPETGLMVLVIALVFSVGFGLIGTWRILGQKPSQWLRDL